MKDSLVLRCCSLLSEVLSSDGVYDGETTAYRLRDFLECFSALSCVEKDELRSILTIPEARKIASLSVNAAEQALFEQDEMWLKWSLLAHDVEQFRDDPRNNIQLLAVTDYAAEKLGIDTNGFFNSVASIMSPRSGRYVREFAARPRALRALRAMGIRADSDGSRVRFIFE